jgi:hypothetical protein
MSKFELLVTPGTYYEFSYVLASEGDFDNYWASIVVLKDTKSTISSTLLEQFSSVRAFNDTRRVFKVITPEAFWAKIAFTAYHVSPPQCN